MLPIFSKYFNLFHALNYKRNYIVITNKMLLFHITKRWIIKSRMPDWYRIQLNFRITSITISICKVDWSLNATVLLIREMRLHRKIFYSGYIRPRSFSACHPWRLLTSSVHVRRFLKHVAITRHSRKELKGMPTEKGRVPVNGNRKV